METYKINVYDRAYERFEVYDSSTLERIELEGLDPVKQRLFNQDVFSFDDSSTQIVHSSTRLMKTIPGVVVLSSKTFGKHKNKFLYQCVPDDKRLPIFLVPMKSQADFRKHRDNQYVVFQFLHWKDKHPRATITQTLGAVTLVSSFYEYQLYCKSLYASIQNFTREAVKQLKYTASSHFIERISDAYRVRNRELWDVLTIDPQGSKDFDDAFSLVAVSEDIVVLSVYIANVSLWLDVLDLWDSFSMRIATIYLPDRRRPMLPTVLSEALCSLQEGQSRFALTMDMTISIEKMAIQKVGFLNTRIRVNKNLRYDTEEQNTNVMYNDVFNLVSALNGKLKYLESIRTSHDVVSYLMLLMNYTCAKRLKACECGIFRSVTCGPCPTNALNAGREVKNFLKAWHSTGGNYVAYEDISGHDLLKFDAYVHITSPIRRLVDLLNIIEIQRCLGICDPSEGMTRFYGRWTDTESLAYINKTMRSIRKVQNDCSLLAACATDESMLSREYDGFIFDKIVRSDGLYQYMVKLCSAKMVSRFTSRRDEPNYSFHKFRIHLFMDETQLKHKVRVTLCPSGED